MKKLEQLIDTILSECSGKVAFDWVQNITRYNRVKGSRDYHLISMQIMAELESYGLDEVKRHVYPCDGKPTAWGWRNTYSSTIRSGELWIVAPEKKRICRYLETPMCVIDQSKSCDVEAEIVDI